MLKIFHIVFALLLGATTGHLYTKSTLVPAKEPQASKSPPAPTQAAPEAAAVSSSPKEPE